MSRFGEIVRQLLSRSRSGAPTAETAQQLQQILTPDPRALQFDAQRLALTVREGREAALAELIGRLVPQRIAAQLGGGDEARSHTAAVLNEPLPPRTPQSLELIHSQSARIQALEECVQILALALVEVLYPAPRDNASVYHTTASRRR